MAGVITASEPSWIAPFTGLSPRQFGKLVRVLRREGADAVRRGRTWSLPLADRALLLAACWRTSLTMPQLAPLFGASKSAADRIIDHLGPMFALRPRKRFAKDAVLIVDGTLVPTWDHAWPSGRRTIGTPPTTRSSTTPTPGWSSWSAGRWPGTATTARRGRSPAPRPQSATPSRSPAAATRAPDLSSLTAASAVRPNCQPGKRNTTGPTRWPAPGYPRGPTRTYSSRWRILPPGRIAVIVLAVLRHDQRLADMADGNNVSESTVRRWRDELIPLLAVQAPHLDREHPDRPAHQPFGLRVQRHHRRTPPVAGRRRGRRPWYVAEITSLPRPPHGVEEVPIMPSRPLKGPRDDPRRCP